MQSSMAASKASLMSSLSLAQLQQTVARYLMALIFCGARSASALALAAALIAGLGDFLVGRVGNLLQGRQPLPLRIVAALVNQGILDLVGPLGNAEEVPEGRGRRRQATCGAWAPA